VRNAANKLILFEKILKDLGKISHCLVYCSPNQIYSVQRILNSQNIIQHKFTQSEGIKPEKRFGWISEREYLIKQFTEGAYQALVSMKCLDEGVDIPPARLAVMLANSGNPREYIQRRGRVLRKFPGKTCAIIHDIIVTPVPESEISSQLMALERKIATKELQRYEEFAATAQNADECLHQLEKLRAEYGLQ